MKKVFMFDSEESTKEFNFEARSSISSIAEKPVTHMGLDAEW